MVPASALEHTLIVLSLARVTIPVMGAGWVGFVYAAPSDYILRMVRLVSYSGMRLHIFGGGHGQKNSVIHGRGSEFTILPGPPAAGGRASPSKYEEAHNDNR